MSGDSNIDSKEGSSSRDSLCWETPQGATELNPDLTGTRVTPAQWGEHLLTGIESWGIFRCWKRGSAPWMSRMRTRIVVVLLGKECGRPDWQRFQLGTLTGCNLNRDPLNQGSSFKAVRHAHYRGIALLGSKTREVTDHWSSGPAKLDSSLGEVADLCRALVSTRGPPQAHLRPGRRRGPRRLRK